MPQWQTYPDHTAEPAAGDTFLMRDVSDTTASANGTVKETPYSAIRPGGSGGSSTPSVVTAATDTHTLTTTERASNDVLLIAPAGTTFEVPADAPEGSIWFVDVATASAVDVQVAGNVGEVNGVAAGAVAAAGSGSVLTVWVRENLDLVAPKVRVSGDTVAPSTLADTLDGDGEIIRNYTDDSPEGNLVGVTLPVAARNSAQVHTGGAGTVTIPDWGNAGCEILNKGTGSLTVVAAAGMNLEGDATAAIGQTLYVRVYGAAGSRWLRTRVT